MRSKSKRTLMDWAQFRFSVIGGLLARPPGRGELERELAALSRRKYLHPTQGTWVCFAPSTIERWYYQALKSENPIEALGRKLRSDTGRTRAMSPALLEALRIQYGNHPDWSYQLHGDNLAALIEMQPELGPMPSYATVMRRMKQKGWYRKPAPPRNPTPGQTRATERLAEREVRSFESTHVNGLWHLDFHEGRRRVVDANGMWHTPHALCILDDCSRLCCHVQWYLHETAENLYHGTLQAFHKRGLPRALMTDNGSAMRAQETQNGLSRIGVTWEAILPYSAYQNGKQENWFAQLEGRLMAMLRRVDPLTLAFLNRATQAWVEMEYNQRRHDEIKMTPLDKFLEGPDVSRPSPDTDALRLAFCVQERRKQRRSDGTLTVKGVRFELPSRFRHMEQVYVRYQSWDLSQVFLVDHRTGDLIARIYPQDKTKNANARRRALEPNENSVLPENQAASDPVPPLLKKLLADYAATGLPPAYLPKQEDRASTEEEENDA